MSSRGCEGSCPVCRLGEVDNHKCDSCGAEFCPKCHGIANGIKSKNVSPCKCKKRKRNKTFELKLTLPEGNRQTKIEKGDILLFRGQGHNYIRIFRPSIKKWLIFDPGQELKRYLFWAPTYQNFLTLAVLIGAMTGFKVREAHFFEKKFDINKAFKFV